MAQQTIDLGSAPNAGDGDPIRNAFDKCNDNFTELYSALTGLVELKGSTDCSTNPNYPAASAGDAYRVSVAGKIGGASGIDVEVGDLYYALADNAGGDQATVGSSWDVLQGNTTGGGGSVAALDDVGDVNAPSPSDGDVLTFDNGTGEWIPAAPAGGSNALDDLTDVNAPSPSDGDVLTFDNGSGEWVPATPSGGSGVWSHIETLSPSTASSVDSTAWAAGGYKQIKFVMNLTFSVSGASFQCQTKQNGAFKTDAFYGYAAQQASSTGNTNLGNNNGTATAITIAGSGGTWGPDNTATSNLSGDLVIDRPDQATLPKRVRYELAYSAPGSTSRYVHSRGGGSYFGTDYAFAVTGLRFLVASGTFSGTIDVYGLS